MTLPSRDDDPAARAEPGGLASADRGDAFSSTVRPTGGAPGGPLRAEPAGPPGAAPAGAFPAEEIVEAELAGEQRVWAPTRGLQSLAARRRRVKLPLALFILTCFSTFWAGATAWVPLQVLLAAAERGNLMPVRQALIANWADGLAYMGAVLAILLTHEMGHFLATVRYRIPASFPYFLPLPITPIGTLGAVIGMEGLRANRREMFDIGLAGPLAGLAVAAPILWIGVQQLDLTTPAAGLYSLDCPLAVRMLLGWIRPPGYHAEMMIANTQLNPFFMAGWIGLLVTGLNMLPVSQLDGGHVVYALFRRRAHWIARLFVVSAITYIVLASAYVWSLMLLLVLLIGTDHPPTRDDTVRLGAFRVLLGLASLAIPVLCFPPHGLIPLN